MTDTINLTDQVAGFNPTPVFEPTEENNSDQAEEVTRPGRRRGRGQLRAAFARERQRPRPAFLVELSQRARRTAETREPEAAAEPDRDAEAAPRGRAALRQQFRQALPGFREANQAGQAGGGGEERRGVVTIPVGLERGTRQGRGGGAGAAAAPTAARTAERPGFQAGAQPTIIANREPPRLDGIRMAASFEQTALGNALNMNRGPANLVTTPADAANQGLAIGRNTAPASRNNPAERPGFGAGAALIRQGDAGVTRPEQGPLARVQRRVENPGNNILNTDQRTPLAANRITRGGNRIGTTQLEQGELVRRGNPGALDESDNALRAGVGTDDIRRVTNAGNQTNRLENDFLTTDQQTPLGAGRSALDQGGIGNTRLEQRPLVGQVNPGQQAIPANRLTGAATEGPGGGIGENVRPAAAPALGVTPPANPLEPEAPNLLVNEPAAPLGGNPGQAVPRLADLQAALEEEEPTANPAPPTPEPPETPSERAAAIRATPAEAADAELRATVPAPIEPPPGAAREIPAAAPGPAEANPAVARPGAGEPGQVGRPGGAPEAPQALRAGFTAETGEEEENGPGVNPPEAVPPEAAPPGAAEGRPPREVFTENQANEARPLAPPGEETEEFEQLQARAVTAYELQQMENRTSEPNERRTVMELFIR
ncbi:MAG: hypothetical protein JSU77_13185 [Fidelibacterota bacterium]|nr:MAG: hypothetical protein JSU77_13185 [Candidatus Neomarinimicrobiota bacterium]